MSKHGKQTLKETPITKPRSFSKSYFKLTFAIELLGITEEWEEEHQGWMDFGISNQQFKIQYQLYYGQSFEIDVAVWPRAAKVTAGVDYTCVRVWQHFTTKWIAFSICHAIPVRIDEMRFFVATVNLSPSTTRRDNVSGMFFPPLEFGQRRYFAPVKMAASDEDITLYFRRLIWNLIVDYIPATNVDSLYPYPHCVSDVRHQDAVVEYVELTVMNRMKEFMSFMTSHSETLPAHNSDDKNKSRKFDASERPNATKNINYVELKLNGESILAGAGRVIHFDLTAKGHELGDMLITLSSFNLPAADDSPMVFVNIEKLMDIPTDHFRQLGISELYTRWTLGDVTKDSKVLELGDVTNNNILEIKDHHIVPLDSEAPPEILVMHMDAPYEIQLRGRRLNAPKQVKPKLFGYEKGDRNFGTARPPLAPKQELDFLIAVTKIDTRILAKGANNVVNGEFPLFPPSVSVVGLMRESICTNDINAIGAPVKPDLLVPPEVVLQAQMTLEVMMGVVGCNPRDIQPGLCYSRLYALIKNPPGVLDILKKIADINEELSVNRESYDLLTGFALDTGAEVFLYLEGPRDGKILEIWQMSADYYPDIKPAFSTSDRYLSRIYSDLHVAAVPFMVLKMHIPLGVLLACPPVYARPALPLLARSAVLKFGRIVASKLRWLPPRTEMPTSAELKSFRLELCAPFRPSGFHLPEKDDIQMLPTANPGKSQATSRISFHEKNLYRNS